MQGVTARLISSDNSIARNMCSSTGLNCIQTCIRKWYMHRTKSSVDAGDVLKVARVSGAHYSNHADCVFIAGCRDLLWGRHKAVLCQVDVAGLNLKVVEQLLPAHLCVQCTAS